MMPTAAEKLATRISRMRTAQLVSLHGLTLTQMYAAADKAPRARKGADSEPYQIVVDAIAEALVRRGVQMTTCCYCPAGHHDERTCDRTGPTPLSRMADAIADAVLAPRRG
jgi:hypothetical protein